MAGLPPSSHRFPARYVTVGSRVGNCYSAERGDGDGAYAAIEPAQVGIHGIGVGVVGHKSLDQIVKLAAVIGIAEVIDVALHVKENGLCHTVEFLQTVDMGGIKGVTAVDVFHPRSHSVHLSAVYHRERAVGIGVLGVIGMKLVDNGLIIGAGGSQVAPDAVVRQSVGHNL